jgi:predicted nucleic acid-binding protein
VGTLLDAFALIAFVGGEPAAPAVRQLLRGGDCAIPTVNLAEAGQRLFRVSDVRREELEQVVGSLPIDVVPFTRPHAWRAAELRAAHYRRADSAVSLADCCLVAVATPADRVATADPAVLRMAAAEGIGTIALPRP